MTTTDIMARIDKFEQTVPFYEDELRDCLAGLRYNLSERPLDAAAYAGVARCKEIMGTAPITILEHYVLSLTLKEDNAKSWEMLAQYAKRRAVELAPGGSELAVSTPEPSPSPAISLAAARDNNPKQQVLMQSKMAIFCNALKEKTHRKLIIFLATCIIAGYAIMARAL